MLSSSVKITANFYKCYIHIKLTILKYIIQWTWYMHMCETITPTVPKYFHHLPKENIPLKQLHTPPFSQPLASTKLLSISSDLPILDTL